MEWIKLKDKLPNESQNGEKILVCRILNEGQKSQNPSIVHIDKIHLMDVEETWWLEGIPELPKEVQ